MLILGATSDDKGAQLEALLESILIGQGYTGVRRNLITAGGNEIDVSAVRESAVLMQTQSTPLMCEAKAYASPLTMPTWHKFLGKLHLARAENASTVGILVALNGVNGNVAGSHTQLSKTDSAVFVIEGRQVANDARERGEIAEVSEIRDQLIARLQRTPIDLDTAYYGGTYYWIARWDDGSYSVVSGHGGSLSTEQLSALKPPLDNSLTGALVASEAEQVEIEARHARRVQVLDRLFHGDRPALSVDGAVDDPTTSLAEEPFCRVDDGCLQLLPPEEMGKNEVSRLFLALFEHPVSVANLAFIAGRLHEPYVHRLIDLMPQIQRGFELDENGQATLHRVAPLFPSLWYSSQSLMRWSRRTERERSSTRTKMFRHPTPTASGLKSSGSSKPST